MLAIERRKSILNQLKQDGRVRVSELGRQFQVTEETIRRDLEKMAREGLVIKSHGGAIINENTSIELPFNTRMKRNIEGKQAIAAIIAGQIRDGSQIVLDASSTSVFIAKALRKKQKLTVITNSVEIIVELADKPNIELISTGGLLESNYLAFTGAKTIRSFGEYNPEIAVVSCKGLSMERGVMDPTDSIANTKQAMIASARMTFLATDHTKFERFALSTICDPGDFNCVVTDRDPGSVWKDYFRERDVKCIYPKR
jgi:DeoR/GlpR family transcriptional regulator of sugar metabolism